MNFAVIKNNDFADHMKLLHRVDPEARQMVWGNQERYVTAQNIVGEVGPSGVWRNLEWESGKDAIGANLHATP